MCFVFMLEFSSLVSCCILDGIVLLIAELCHSCFACHLQTVHLIPVIFISISIEIISSFQRNTWFAKLRPGSILPFRSTHMHCISHPAYHAMFCIMLLAHCTVIDCWSFACVLALGRARRRVRDRGTCWVRLQGSRFRQLKELAGKMTKKPRNHFYLCLLVDHSIAMLRYLPLALSCLPYCHVKPLNQLS